MSITGQKSRFSYLMATHRKMHPNCPAYRGTLYSAGASMWRFCNAENRTAHPLLEGSDEAAKIRHDTRRCNAQSMRDTSAIRTNVELCAHTLETQIPSTEQLHRRHVLLIGGHGGSMPFLWLHGMDTKNDDKARISANLLLRLGLTAFCVCAIIGAITIVRWLVRLPWDVVLSGREILISIGIVALGWILGTCLFVRLTRK